MKSIEIKGGETVTYRESKGVGDPILLIHGGHGTSMFYMNLLRKNPWKNPLIAPDMPGFGSSSYRNPHTEISQWAEDLLNFIQALGISSCHVIGYDSGSAPATLLAIFLGEKAKSLHIVSGIAPNGLILRKKNGEPFSMEDDLSEARGYHMAMLEAVQDGNTQFISRLWRLLFFHEKKIPEEDLQEQLHALLQSQGLKDYIYALLSFDITEKTGNGQIKELVSETFLYYGMLDRLIPYEISKDIPGMYPGNLKNHYFLASGHPIFVSEGPEITEAIGNHIADVENRHE